jgi:hypothetical protein
MTLVEQLGARVTAEQAEIARIKADALSNVAAAQQRIQTLQQAQTIITNNPQIEGLIDALHKMGIDI